MDRLVDLAGDGLGLIEVLVFELGRLDQEVKRLGEAHVERLLKSMTYYMSWTHTAKYKQQRDRERAFLKRLIGGWTHDVTPLVRVLKPFAHKYERGLHDAAVAAFYDELCCEVVPRYARQLVAGFRQKGLIADAYSSGDALRERRHLLLDVEGALWTGCRADLIALLATANQDPVVHENAYEFLHWLDYALRRKAGVEEDVAAEKWLRDEQLCKALWAAATCRPLNPRAVGSLRTLPARLAKMGIPVVVPAWWEEVIQLLGPETPTDGPAK